MTTTKVLCDGIWVLSEKKYYVYEVKDGIVKKRNLAYYDYPELQLDEGIVSWNIGVFSIMPKTLQELTGGNIHFNFKLGTGKEGFLSNDGKTILTIPKSGASIETIKWVSQEEFQIILDSRENWDQASTFYPISSQRGKILFLNGAPGAGKSTASYALAKNHGYVFYEGDCFTKLVNPYVPLDVELDVCDTPLQMPLKNYPMEVVKAVNDDIIAFTTGDYQIKEEVVLRYYEELAKNVKQEWQRIGGQNWVVGRFIPKRSYREAITKIIPGCIFVNLTLSSEAQAQRLENRYAHWQTHIKEKALARLTKGDCLKVDASGADEKNVVDLVITPDLDSNDVVNKILEVVKNVSIKKF